MTSSPFAILMIQVSKAYLEVVFAIASDIPGLRNQAVWCGNRTLAKGQTAMWAMDCKELHQTVKICKPCLRSYSPTESVELGIQLSGGGRQRSRNSHARSSARPAPEVALREWKCGSAMMRLHAASAKLKRCN